MRLIVQTLIGAAVLVVIFMALNLIGALVGLLFYLLIAAVVGAAVVAVVGGYLREQRRLKPPSCREEHRVEKSTDRALDDLEKRINRQ